MRSIYEHILGESYHELHPKLQHRYRLTIEQPFKGQGVMTKISGGSPFIRLFLKLGVKYRLFFSERGTHIPFLIENTTYLNEQGKQVVTWDRTFSFPKVNRHFDAIMFVDDSKREVVDAFGKPSVLISTLTFQVENGTMHILPKKQWLVLFGRKIPLPNWLYGKADILEYYDDERDCYCIRVTVHNAIVGNVFHYEGTFHEVQS